jgi:hypothetical protein
LANITTTSELPAFNTGTLFGRLEKCESIVHSYKDTGQQQYWGDPLILRNVRLVCPK